MPPEPAVPTPIAQTWRITVPNSQSAWMLPTQPILVLLPPGHQAQSGRRTFAGALALGVLAIAVALVVVASVFAR